MGRKKTKHDYPLSNSKAWIIALLTILLAIALMALGSQLENGSICHSIANAVSSTLLAVGIVSFLYEFFLRATVGKEMLNLVGIKESISKNQITWAGRESEVTWEKIFNKGSKIYILLPEPSWLHQHWHGLKTKAEERSITITLLLPNPEGPKISQIAEFLSTSSDDLAAQINEASTMVEKSWTTAKAHKKLEAGSSLKIAHFEDFPSYGLIASDQSIVATIFSPTQKAPLDKGFSIAFHGSAKDYPVNWFITELIALSEIPATFENEIPHE
ncbi:hypothetical protein KUV86_03730 [Halomonas sp. DP8Y7-3]|uniref:hypothetical protein n=1 Tax=Halomonas sp. DP8Y7-3 TaxID=2859079 RepID=UPI001C945CEE|nr:hypothetical protein [Halomonas sp. DP8Y7-3]MBY5928219.1 hypothetical protein [Halomonas sp. DP8Y7-3]